MKALYKQKSAQASALRAQGKTYREIGAMLDISDTYARHLTQISHILQTREEPWTAGLSARSNLALRHLGFHSRQEVALALHFLPDLLDDIEGLGTVSIHEIHAWIHALPA